METTRSPAQSNGSQQSECPRVSLVPIDHLRTSLEALRGGCKPIGAYAEILTLAELPLRVTQVADDRFEVLDGFKRLAKWRAAGLELVPVVLEAPPTSVEEKVALLMANRPPRTLTPMDEARVVHALRYDEGLGPTTIARVCGQKRTWVMTRLTLAEQLAPQVVQRVDAGTLGVTLAHALCALKPEAQQAVCEAIEQHGLKGREALALVSAYRVTEGEPERRRLLSEPLEVVRPSRRSASPLGALGTRIEEKLGRVREALETIAEFRLPEEGLTPAERRRLETEHRAVLHELFQTAQAVAVEHLGLEDKEIPDEGQIHDSPPGTGRAHASHPAPPHEVQLSHARNPGATRPDQGASRDGLRHTAHREQSGAGSQGGAQSARADGDAQEEQKGVNRRETGQQARPLPRPHPGEGGQGPDYHPYPPRDPRSGLHRQPYDLGDVRAPDPYAARAQEEGLAAVRDPSG